MLSFSITPNSLAFLLLAFTISIIDIRSYRIPDPLLALSAFISILLALIFDRQNILYRFLHSGGAFLLFYGFSRIMKTGFGFGDVKFISVAAFNLGIFDSWVMLCVAFLCGLIFSLFRKSAEKADTMSSRRIAFAPFLSLGALVSLFANPPRL